MANPQVSHSQDLQILKCFGNSTENFCPLWSRFFTEQGYIQRMYAQQTTPYAFCR